MNTESFIVELIKPLAWPVTLVVILFTMRKPLTELILLIQKFKFRDLELEFGRKAEELAARATTELPAPRGQLGTVVIPDKYFKLAEASPRASLGVTGKPGLLSISGPHSRGARDGDKAGRA